jgi:hypothetical protein
MKKKLTKLIVVCVLCAVFMPNITQAQQGAILDVQEWPKGKVVLTDGDTVYGALSYYRAQDVVNVHHEDGTLSSFSPVNVEYFIAQDMPSGRSYTFRTLHWDMDKPNSDFKKPTFFEELNRGMVILLVREIYLNRNGNNGGAMSSNTHNSDVSNSTNLPYDQIAQQYFLLLPNNKIVKLRNLRKDLHSLFGNRSKEVKSYIKLNRLDYDKRHELVAIINYFNAISSTTGLAF